MRITNNRLTRNYLTNANKNLEYYSESSDKLVTGRAFTRVSQNVSGGKKAMRLRTQLYQNAQYQKNISAANEKLTIAEQSLLEMSEVIVSIKEQATRAVGVADQSTLDTLASTIDEFKATVLQYSNASYVGEYVFGGTNAKTTPFTVDEQGNLLYNMAVVSGVSKNDVGEYFDANGNLVQLSETTYIDIGIGLKNSADGSIDFESAYEVSFSGLDCIGFGTTEVTYTDKEGNEVTENVSNNVYDIATELSKALREGNIERVQMLNDRMTEAHNNVLTNVSELGVKTSYLERNLTMLKDEEVEIETMQSDLEGISDTEEIVKMNEYKYAWMLTLQFGGNVLPQSLMDFIK